jgi:hydroxypyruvate reductase
MPETPAFSFRHHWAEMAGRVWQAAVQAASPETLIARHIRRQGFDLGIGAQTYDLRELKRIIILAAGKAAPGMARGLLPFLDPNWGGLVVLPRGGRDTELMLPQLEAGHPVPDEASLASGLVWERFASEAGPRDLIIVLLSGGASALLADPAAGITLADMQAATRSLLGAGVPIEQINAVRKHVSRIKGGQFAAMAAEAHVATLVLSDVVDDRLDVIASGPTVPDRTTFAEALAVAETVHATQPLPASVLRHLRAGAAGDVAETPKGDEAFWSRHHITCIGNRLTLLEAARQAAEAEGLTVHVHGEPVTGEAAEVGTEVVRALRSGADGTPRCWLGSGETTVTLGATTGLGGRSQELALAAAIAMESQGGIGLLAAGSDGIDGPTAAAGAWADGTSVMHGSANGRDPEQDLAGHDSHGFFAATGGLWIPGPTGTNVGDLVIGLTWPTDGV